MKTECPHRDDANAFLAGEFTAVMAAEFEEHVAGCEVCRKEVAELSELRKSLLALPEVDPSPHLATEILERVQARPRVGWPQIASIAAGIAIVVGAIHFTRREPDSAAPAIAAEIGAARGLEWLARVQEADGSWSAERWGGQKLYGPALTALPLLAIASNQDAMPGLGEGARRAAEHLLTIQNPDGTFGAEFRGSPYNHSIATFALLRAWQRHPTEIPRSQLEKAIGALISQQLPSGEWGYREGALGDRSITQWHVLALHEAASLGWEYARPAADRGLRWLAANPSSLPDTAEPDDSTSALLARATSANHLAPGSLDLYHAYFQTAALRTSRTASAAKVLAELREEILRHQTLDGEYRGSWAPADQWARAGGRLYATALASLSLASR